MLTRENLPFLQKTHTPWRVLCIFDYVIDRRFLEYFSPTILRFLYESRTFIFRFRTIKGSSSLQSSSLTFLPVSTQFKIQIPPTGNFFTIPCRVCVYFTPPLLTFVYSSLIIRQSFNIPPCVLCLAIFFDNTVFSIKREKEAREKGDEEAREESNKLSFLSFQLASPPTILHPHCRLDSSILSQFFALTEILHLFVATAVKRFCQWKLMFHMRERISHRLRILIPFLLKLSSTFE